MNGHDSFAGSVIADQQSFEFYLIQPLFPDIRDRRSLYFE